MKADEHEGPGPVGDGVFFSFKKHEGLADFHAASRHSQITALERVNQEPLPPSLPLHALVHGQASQEDHRNRVPGKLSGGGFGEALEGDRTGSKRVVTEHLLFTGTYRDVGPP